MDVITVAITNALKDISTESISGRSLIWHQVHPQDLEALFCEW